MSVELSDLRVWVHRYGTRPVTAAEVASACPTEVLIAVLVERGVGVFSQAQSVVTWRCTVHNVEVRWADASNCSAGAYTVDCRIVERLLVDPAEPVVGGVS